MLNMMRLDWLGMRKYRSRLIIAVITACMFGGLFGAWMILPYLVFGMFDASLYCFDAEEKGELNRLYLTLPISRGTLITARYMLSLILQGIGIVAGVVLTLIFSRILYGRTIINEHTFIPNLGTLAVMTCASLLICAYLSLIMHPILHKFGYAKAKIIGYVLPIVGSSLLVVIFIMTANRIEAVGAVTRSAFLWAYGNPVLFSFIILCVTVLFLTASYALSLKVYAKRDF
ncbi:MAG: ABC-2 transporter permease [Defluviitaleaceae bacterium]|nr:ABC-2 transporter permease [Defluviitaleaceae bacterium]